MSEEDEVEKKCGNCIHYGGDQGKTLHRDGEFGYCDVYKSLVSNISSKCAHYEQRGSSGTIA